jgi:hypothetical protein
MKILFALFLCLVSFAYAGQPVYGLQVFDSWPHMCQVNANGIGESRQWTPAQAGLTQPIYIKRAAIWVGAAYGFRGDIAHSLSAGANVLSSEGWDHYAEPTGAAGQVRDISWGGDYVKLAPYDVLTFGWACSGFGHGGPVQWIVTIWYTLAP